MGQGAKPGGGGMLLGQKISDRVAEVFESDQTALGSIGSGYTYSGHPVGAAAALACLDETLRIRPHENAAARGRQLYDGLCRLQEKHALIGDVRGGHGLMTALELVADRDSKTPASKAVIAKAFEAIYQAGVMVRVSGPNMIFSPPLVLTAKDVDTILAAVDEGLTAAGS